MRRVMTGLFALIAISTIGCATTQSLPVEDRSRTFDAEYDDVFRASVAMLTENGYAVTDADSEMGIINTDYQQNSTLAAAFIGRRQQKVTLMVRPIESSTKVVATIALEAGNLFGGNASQTMTGSQARGLYGELFEAIQLRLDEAEVQ